MSRVRNQKISMSEVCDDFAPTLVSSGQPRASTGTLGAEMFHWVYGRPPMLLRESDLRDWPGGTEGKAQSEPLQDNAWAGIRSFKNASSILIRDHELSTIVPLELGGALLVTAIYCDGDKAVNSLLDVIPVAGWELLDGRFRSDGGNFVLFNSAIRGADFTDPKLQRKLLEEHGGLLKFPLAAGSYEVDWNGPWRPDARTELWLTRLVRVGA